MRPKLRPVSNPQPTKPGTVTCRHCGNLIQPVAKHTQGAGAWLLLLAILVVGAFFPPLLLFFWVPVFVKTTWHICPVCRLKLD